MKFGIFGATGEVGREVVRSLCLLKETSPTVVEVVNVYVRRDLKASDCFFYDQEKEELYNRTVQQHIIDFDSIDSYTDLKDDAIFCCLGSTTAKGEIRKVDHDYVVSCAKRARELGATKFMLCSSTNADQNSRFQYMRTKGEAERDVRQIPFKQIGIFRPGLLLCPRRETRLLEGIARTFAFLDFMHITSIQASHVAAAMVRAATVDSDFESGTSPKALPTDSTDCQIKIFNMTQMTNLAKKVLLASKSSPPRHESRKGKNLATSISRDDPDRDAAPKRVDDTAPPVETTIKNETVKADTATGDTKSADLSATAVTTDVVADSKDTLSKENSTEEATKPSAHSPSTSQNDPSEAKPERPTVEPTTAADTPVNRQANE